MKLRRISIIAVLSLVLVAVSHGKNLKGTTIDQTEPVSIVATSSSCGCCNIVPVTTCGCGCTSPPPPPPSPPPPEPAPVQPKTLPLAPAEKETVHKAEAENERSLKVRESVPPAPMKKKEGPIVDKMPDPEESSEKVYEAMPSTMKAQLGPNALTSLKRQKSSIKNTTQTTNK